MAPMLLSHPALKVGFVGWMASLPGWARAATRFPELDGVPEQLALRTLAMDTEWSWSFLGLIVLVVALLAVGPRRDKE